MSIHAPGQTPGLEKPFHVRCSGAFLAGYDTKEAASMDADRRNEKARDLKIKATYKVHETPKEG